MDNFISTSEKSGDLFEKLPLRRRAPVLKAEPPPELVTARLLCRQLRRKLATRDKQRIAHLICLNLLSMLRRGS
jgi:hypothetical protein